METVGVRAPESVTGMLNVPAALVDGLAAGAELHRRRLGDGQRVDRGTAQGGAPVGVPRVKVSVWLGPGSERSVPVMVWVVCPIPNVSGLAVTPLKAVPATAVPPSVNGTVTVSLTSLTVLLPALAT